LCFAFFALPQPSTAIFVFVWISAPFCPTNSWPMIDASGHAASGQRQERRGIALPSGTLGRP
jgi:hypothetical protein